MKLTPLTLDFLPLVGRRMADSAAAASCDKSSMPGAYLEAPGHRKEIVDITLACLELSLDLQSLLNRPLWTNRTTSVAVSSAGLGIQRTPHERLEISHVLQDHRACVE